MFVKKRSRGRVGGSEQEQQAKKKLADDAIKLIKNVA